MKKIFESITYAGWTEGSGYNYHTIADTKVLEMEDDEYAAALDDEMDWSWYMASEDADYEAEDTEIIVKWCDETGEIVKQWRAWESQLVSDNLCTMLS